ncbi:MAG: NAD(P)/FAD-dependent oxidoreductase [Piscinibacter sp.]|nr:NAD(P)/FAD-dependent oxidoreductase [Piscinibacter sp.]
MPDAPPASEQAPIVIVGAGPVGVRCAQELRRRDPAVPIVVYGTEAWQPYNRVKLSSLLAGDSAWSELTDGLALPDDIELRLGCSVLAIDRERRTVSDSTRRVQPYADLVLATGSRPHVPDVPGIGQAHVYVFRDLDDAQALVARRARSRRTVVIGGGLLGLEAARAMQRLNTEVWVIEHGPRLLGHQLDEPGAQLLAAHARRQGLQVLTGERVKAINGHGSVTGVTLRSGERIDCDTVIVAAGIRPNVELALDAGLPIGRGVRVDDRMASADPHVFAIGECAEHRGRVYGLLAPGLEQAAVAAHSLLGGTSRYQGSLVATRLKVLDLPLFSIGEVEVDVATAGRRLRSVDHDADGVHRRLVLERGRLIGALAVGPCAEMGRLQEATLAQRRIRPWQAWRFRRRGAPWGEAAAGASVLHWPGPAIVCNCNGVTRAQLGDALAGGCRSVAELSACTRAGSVCGSCKPLLAELAGAPAAPVPTAWGLGSLAGVAALAALLFLLLPGVGYQLSVQEPLNWDRLWRDGLFKQVSGFTLLALSVAAVVLGLRKRVPRFTLGRFDLWRLVHVAIGASTLLVLLAHTGGRIGHALNMSLVLFYGGLLLLGALAAGTIAFEGRLPARAVRAWREKSVWLHILLFWPVPVLLGLHVLKTYFY